MYRAYTILLIFFAFSLEPASSKQESITLESILKDLVNASYDSRIRPIIYNSKGTQLPLNVSISMYIASLDLNTKNGELGIQFFLREHWKDPRLVYKDRGEIIPPFVQFAKKPNEDLIWTPDTFVQNQKISKTSQSQQSLIKLWADGTLTYSRFLSITVPCETNFSNFPTANVTCSLTLESYGFSVLELDYEWSQTEDKAVTWNKEFSQKDFRLQEVKYEKRIGHYSTGSYSALNVKFNFDRSYGSEVIRLYIPSVMIVFISWISFWIHSNHLVAKTFVSISTMIMMLILSSSSTKEIPQTSYPKAIDYWMGTCYFFLFMSLIELGLVAYLDQKKRAVDGNQPKVDTLLNEYQVYLHHGNRPYKGWNLPWLFKNDLPNAVDVISRIIFPIAFFLFIGLYVFLTGVWKALW